MHLRQSFWDCMHASEALLKTDELSEDEMQAIEQMLDRLSEKLLSDPQLQKPRPQRPLQKIRRPDHCSHRRLLDDVLDADGQPTNLVYCLECGAIMKDPAKG